MKTQEGNEVTKPLPELTQNMGAIQEIQLLESLYHQTFHRP